VQRLSFLAACARSFFLELIMANAESLTALVGPSLQQRLARAERVNRWKAQALILPLVLFLLLVFLVPIVALLCKSVGNPEVLSGLPRTVTAIASWDGKALPDESAYQALSLDLAQARKEQNLGDLSKRLNMELAGYRSLMMKTARALPFKTTPSSYKEALEGMDERWGDPAYWQVIRRNTSSVTPFYLLAAVDHRVDDLGEVAPTTPDQAIYIDIFARTFWMGLVITVICLLLAYPLAYLLANLPSRQSNLLMILVLLPFWTSILVRVAAWIVLLQSGGLINSALQAVGLIDQPLELVFNRTGVYISMVHIMLPFMILPIYSVMKGISPTYMRAAISLGCHPFASFWRVYFPQTLAGVGAGGLLVFILSVGYYITPALLGSPSDQMVSYFVAFYTNTSINWGMATALGGLLLFATLMLYVIYSWLVGASRLRLS
jgi:putative spermidine/putrescine transport system permease protein